MTVKQHALLGGIASLILLPVLGLGAIPFWMGSVLIDVDHYLEFVYNSKLTSFSLKKAFHYHSVLFNWLSKPEFLNMSYFHTIEFLSLFYVLAAWLDAPMLKAAFWGMLFHVLLDAINLLYLGVIRIRAHSIIEFLIRKEIMKRNGLDPSTVFNEALNIALQGNSKKAP